MTAQELLHSSSAWLAELDTIQTLKWRWDYITNIKLIKQYPLRNSLPLPLTNTQKYMAVGVDSGKQLLLSQTPSHPAVSSSYVQQLPCSVLFFASLRNYHHCFWDPLGSPPEGKIPVGKKKNHRFSTTVIHLSFPRNVHTKKYFRNTCILPHCWSFS